MLNKVGIRYGADNDGEVYRVTEQIRRAAADPEIKPDLWVRRAKGCQLRADNLPSEGHRQGHRETSARRFTQAGKLGAGCLDLLQDPDCMLIELAAIMRQAKRFRPAHKKLQPDILFQPRNRTADCRFRGAKLACRRRDAAVIGDSNEGGKMIDVPIHERNVQ